MQELSTNLDVTGVQTLHDESPEEHDESVTIPTGAVFFNVFVQ